jgi:hypothetical protein
MKKYFALIFWMFLLGACSSPNQLIKNENYDLAVEKLSRKMRTGKVRTKDVDALRTSYHAANQIDHDQIQWLKASGKADIWPEVYERYSAMNDRQNKVRFLSEDIRQDIGFQIIQYEQLAIEARNKAVDYLVLQARTLLNSESKANARIALDHLETLERIYPAYDGLNQMKRQAMLQATNHVLVQFDNQSGMSVPDAFVQELMNFSARDFEEALVSYDFVENRNVQYDYIIYVSLKQIIISPEKVDTRRFVEKKEIEDGVQPKRDSDGNILLDSTGKVLEEPRYRIVEAFVNETILSKEAVLRASVDYYDNVRQKNIHTIPLENGVSFLHSFAIVNGDLRACSKETIEMMNRAVVPFPPDGVMVMDACRLLHQDVKQIMRREAGIVKKTNE